MVLSVPTLEEKLLQERINSLVLNKNKLVIFISHKYVTQRNKGKKWMNLLWYCASPAVTCIIYQLVLCDVGLWLLASLYIWWINLTDTIRISEKLKRY